MILVILFVVLNAIYIAGLVWCILAIRSTTKIGAQVVDIHTEKLRQAFGEISALRESTFPKYAGAVVPLPDTEWAAHDAVVSEALAAKAQENAQYAKVTQNAAYGRVGVWQTQPMDAVSAYPPELTAKECPSCGSPDRAAKPVIDTGEQLQFHCDNSWHIVKGVPMADPETAPFFTQSQPEK